jgi:hypothetical protein
MKTPEDEAFDDLAKRQGAWGGGFPAKRAMAADKLQEPAQEQEEDWGALAEKQLASIKRDTQASFEGAMVRATHKVMAEREAQTVQEPEAWGFRSADGAIYDCISPEAHDECEGSYTVPLYTTPPQRPWVGLTEEEMEDIRASFLGQFLETWEFAYKVQVATQAKLKEKNG